MTKLTAALAVAPVPLIAQAQQQQRPAPARPNIVLILADDLGYSDLGCYGGEIATPNLDKLATQGLRFTSFYNQARCCPSRAALMTGRYPHQVGVGAMIDNYAKWQRDAANRPSYSDHLSKDSPTLPELLKSANYRTLMCGKWHLGDEPTQWPAARGFTRSFALIPGAMNYWGGESTGPRSPMALDTEKFTPPHDGFFSTDAFTDKAIEFIQEAVTTPKPSTSNQQPATSNSSSPFFLYMAYNAPHWPLHAPPEDIEPYKHTYDAGWQPIRDARFKRMVEANIIPPETKMAPMDRGQQKPWDQLTDDQRNEWSLRMAIYAAQVTRLDKQIGRLISELDRLNQTDNTLILFVSDNGGAPEDPHRGRPGAALGSRDSFWGYARPWATVSNTPWRYHKISAYEGGTSTPAIISWPAAIPPDTRGQLVRQPAHLIDLMPTFLDLAGAKYPATPDRKPEGLSLHPLLKAELADHAAPTPRTFCWEHEGNRGIRKGKWKLVSLPTPDDNAWELYDLDADRTEQNDLAKDHPEVVADLAKAYADWAKRCDVVPWSELAPKKPGTAPRK